MIDHIGFPVSDYARARAFYTEALAPLGYGIVMEVTQEQTGHAPAAGFGADGKPDFWIGGGTSGRGLPGGLSCGGSAGWPGVAGGISGGSIPIDVATLLSPVVLSSAMLRSIVTRAVTAPTGQCSVSVRSGTGHAGAWHTASMLWPSGSSTKAP